MTDFDYDVMMKKRIANQARHKKGTKGRKGCRLPSDYLTEREKKKMNGEVKTVKLGVPMKWDEFKKLSKNLKLEYLNDIKEKYHPSIRQYAELFGAPKTTVQAYFHDAGFKTGGGFGNGAKSRADEKLWAEFIGKTDIPETPVEEEKKTDPLPEENKELFVSAQNIRTLEIGVEVYEALDRLSKIAERMTELETYLDEIEKRRQRAVPSYGNYSNVFNEMTETTPNSLNVSFRGVTFDEVYEKLKPLLEGVSGCFRIEFAERYLSPTYILKHDED